MIGEIFTYIGLASAISMTVGERSETTALEGNSFNTRASRATRTRKQLVPRLFNSCHGFSTRTAT